MPSGDVNAGVLSFARLFFLVFRDMVLVFDRDGLNVEDDDFNALGVGAPGAFSLVVTSLRPRAVADARSRPVA